MASTAARRTSCQPYDGDVSRPPVSAASGSSFPRANFLELRQREVRRDPDIQCRYIWWLPVVWGNEYPLGSTRFYPECFPVFDIYRVLITGALVCHQPFVLQVLG
jgi:hypothetical protein